MQEKAHADSPLDEDSHCWSTDSFGFRMSGDTTTSASVVRQMENFGTLVEELERRVKRI